MSTGRERRGTIPRRSPARADLLRLRDTVWGDPRSARAAARERARARPKGARATAAAGLARFGLVGVSGIVVNEAAIAALVSGLGLHYVVGYLLATQFSTLWNFAFIETWAFKNASPTNRRWHRFVMLMLVNNIANVLTAPLFVVFTSVLGINYLVSNILTLSLIFVARFAVADRIWGGVTGKARKTVVYEDASDATADLLKLHRDTVASARAGGRRFARPVARRTLHEALVTEQTALLHLGFGSFAEFRAKPAERVGPEPDYAPPEFDITELRARIADLEAERAQPAYARSDTLAPIADHGAVVSSTRLEHQGQQEAVTHQAARAKWFP